MAKWFIILLLISGACVAKIDDVEIGGLEYGAVRWRLPEGSELNPTVNHIGRWILGDLKRDMQLGGYTQGKSIIHTFADGVTIQAKSIFGDDGLADQDEIVVIAGKKKPQISIVGFSVYFKEHTNYTPVETFASHLIRQVQYYVAEPYLTTSGGIMTYVTEEGDHPHYVIRSQYEYSQAEGLDNPDLYVKAPNRDDDTLFGNGSWIKMFQVYYDDGVDTYNFHDWGRASASNYGLYGLPNTSFTGDTGFTFADGYIGKVGMRIDRDITYSLAIPDEVQAMMGVYHNTMQTIRTELTSAQSDSFIPGFYAIGAENGRHLTPFGFEDPGDSLGQDYGGYTLVFHLSNGDNVAYDFNFVFDFVGYPDTLNILSTKVILFDPTQGVVNEYEMPDQVSNPFFDRLVGGNIADNTIQHREIPDTIAPIATHDVFANYRNDFEIIN